MNKNLRDADLQGADLQGADLRNANLRGASLQGADLWNANLQGASLPIFQIPQHGTLTVWKQASHGVLLKLLVPASAKRTAVLVGRKCRAEYVKVLDILQNKKRLSSATSKHDATFTYRRGEKIYPDSYNDDIRLECTYGIHFFLTKEEAEAYR